jgi:F-type H+-transporting ATPase subunit gamma
MATLKSIKEELKIISAIKELAESYQEIASLKVNKIKNEVLKNREFFKEIIELYKRIKSAKKDLVSKSLKEKKDLAEKTAIVVISANHFFYGPLLLNIWNEAKNYFTKIDEQKRDIIIVGRIAKYYAEREKLGHKIFYFEISDDNPEEKKLIELIEFITNYKKIIVFHGKYEGAINQKVEITEIAAESILKKEGAPRKHKEEKISYIFEPSKEEIIDFFEAEIVATIFNQTILEHQLARYASRVISMYQSIENAKKTEKMLSLTKNKVEREILNKKQSELFANLLLKSKKENVYQ